MKDLLIFLILISLFFIDDSCKKEPFCACGVERPQENLSWLKTKLKTRFSADIYQVFFEDVEYIVVCDPPGPDAMRIAYSCTGILVCEDGGYLPGAVRCNLLNPMLFWQEFDVKKILIIKYRHSPF